MEIPPLTPLLANGADSLHHDADPGGAHQDDRLVRLFYENFHVAHPILVPAAMYHNRQYPQFLQTVVKFIGSHYLSSGPSRTLRGSVDSALTVSQDRTPSMVQARLLYAIALFANDERSEALETYSKSVELATEIGMHRSDFASSLNLQQPIEAESLRRTWWELYIVDVFMNISSTPVSFRCNVPTPEVALPCEESVYARGAGIPESAQFLDFKGRIFAVEETVFSSFSYRVEAMMILCRALLLNQIRDPHRDHLQAVENALVSWVNHLPAKKLDIVDAYGNVDEMMFQAHVIIAYAAMLIHLPRSELRRLLVPQDVGCWPCTIEALPATFSRTVHSIKSTEASRRVSDFISICPNIQKHSPLIIPALGLCGMTQLATSVSHTEDCLDHHYNRVTLVLGCLRVMRRTWVSADMAYSRVRTCAAKMLSDSATKWTTKPSEKHTSPLESPNNPGDLNQNSSLFRQLPDNQAQLSAAFAQEFIDPTCYVSSIFNSFGDFDMQV
ncbi:C6 transcription factor [Seiridium cupressi]